MIMPPPEGIWQTLEKADELAGKKRKKKKTPLVVVNRVRLRTKGK